MTLDKNDALVIDALMSRRVRRNGQIAILTIERSVEGTFEVIIEKDHEDPGEAKFSTMQEALQFFEYATDQLLGDRVGIAAFQINDEKTRFLNIIH